MDLVTLSEEFKKKGLTLGSIESFTGGSFASSITKIPGASKFFKGAVVTYATEEKIRILKISPALINQVGVVSFEVASDMCTRGRTYLNTDVCVSFTGNAGPTAMEGKPVGEVYIGVASQTYTKVFRYLLKGSREEIQNQAIALAADQLSKLIKEIQ